MLHLHEIECIRYSFSSRYLVASVRIVSIPSVCGISFSFFGIQAAVAVCLEIVLFLPQVVFRMPKKDQVTGKLLKFDQENLKRGFYMFLCIFSFAFGLDFYVKSRNPKMYIPLNHLKN